MKRLGQTAWPTVGGLLIALFSLRTVSDPAFWMHLASGRYIAAHGLPRTDPFSWWLAAEPVRWINDTWLADLLLYTISQAGIPALQVVLVLSFSVGCLLMVSAGRRRTGPEDRAAALLIGGWVMAPGIVHGPLLLAAPAIGGTLALLARSRHPGWRRWLGLVVLQVAWANLHPSFLLGPVSAALLWWRGPASRRRLALPAALGLAAATLINPYGIELHLDLLSRAVSVDRQVVLSWISPFHEEFLPDPTRHLATVFLLLMAAPVLLSRRRLPPALLPAAVTGAFLMLRSPQHALEAGLLGLPMAALGVATLRGHARRRLPPPAVPWCAVAARTALAAGLVLTAADTISNRAYRRSGHVASFGIGVEDAVFPSTACLDRIRALAPSAALGNLAFDGGYLAWALPERKVFTDPRGHLYGQAFFARVYQAFGGEEAPWLALQEHRSFSALLVPATWLGAGRVIHILLLTERWELVYFDGTSALLLRRTSENDGVLAGFEGNGSEALAEAVAAAEAPPPRGWRAPDFPVRVAAAARVYQAAGEYERSLRLYPLVLQRVPRMAGAWYDLGVACVKTGAPTEAARLLARYTGFRPGDIQGWLWLGRALEDAGRTAEANTAYAQAAAIDPVFTRLFRDGGDASFIPARP